MEVSEGYGSLRGLFLIRSDNKLLLIIFIIYYKYKKDNNYLLFFNDIHVLPTHGSFGKKDVQIHPGFVMWVIFRLYARSHLDLVWLLSFAIQSR